VEEDPNGEAEHGIGKADLTHILHPINPRTLPEKSHREDARRGYYPMVNKTT